MRTENYIRTNTSRVELRGNDNFWNIKKRGHPTLQRIWTDFPTVRDLISAKPSQICYGRYGSWVSSRVVKGLEQMLEGDGLHFGVLPPKK